MRRMHCTEVQNQSKVQPHVSKQNQLGGPGTTGINKNTHCDPNETHVKEHQLQSVPPAKTKTFKDQKAFFKAAD